jgi:hypothetical protein
MKKNELEIDSKYKWKYQEEVLIYLGQQGFWYQFALEKEPDVVWCEVLEQDLSGIEVM